MRSAFWLAMAAASAAWSAQDSAESIMQKVAANQDRAVQARSGFLYHQSVLVRLKRGNGQLAREESSEYDVSPTPTGTKKERTAFLGKTMEHGKVVEYSTPGQERMTIDIDGSLIADLPDDLTNDKRARDGMDRSLFPLTAQEQAKYVFRLEGSEEYRGIPVFKITFLPKSSESAWGGEALIDREEYQPVLVTTYLAHGVPFIVKAALGTNVQQAGFKVTYRKFERGLWFTVTYGGEFKVRALFLYVRRVGISMQNSGFQRARVESTVKFEDIK